MPVRFVSMWEDEWIWFVLMSESRFSCHHWFLLVV